MASSTLAAFLTALKASLAARFAAHGSLSAVRVDLVSTADTSATDSVILAPGLPIDGTQTYLAMGRRQDEFAIPGSLQTYATGSDSDLAFQAAMDKAALILDEIIFEVRDNKPSVGAQTLEALVTDTTYTPLVGTDGGWYVRCTFAIDYQAIVT